MILFNDDPRKCTDGIKLIKSQEKIYRLMCMDDIELYAKNEKESETLILAVSIYSQDIGMEFGIKNVSYQQWEVENDKWR